MRARGGKTGKAAVDVLAPTPRRLRVRRVAVPALAVAAILGLSTGPAFAYNGDLGTYHGTLVRIRSTPHTSGGTVYGLGNFGNHACTTLATKGDSVNGDVWWDYNKNLTTGVHIGYSADAYMYPFYYDPNYVLDCTGN
jgi:hypothetical protein